MLKTLTRLAAIATVGVTFSTQAAEAPIAKSGLITLKSHHSVPQTVNRLVRALNEKKMTIFTRIDHAAGAAKVDLKLPATQVVIFGNPKIGTPLMKCAPTIAIDLPQKALIWEDKAGDVWFAYNRPTYLKERHDIDGCKDLVMKVENAMAAFANAATKAD